MKIDKKFIGIIVIVLLAISIIVVYSKLVDNEVIEEETKLTYKEYKDNKYYIIEDDYDKEYDIEYKDYSEDFQNRQDKYDDFEIHKVLDYKESVNDAKKGDIAYFDPPYDKDEGQSSFVEYNQTVFGREDQIKLKELCDELVARGVTVGVSNSGTSFIKDLYKGYKIVCFDVNRTIGGTQESRHMYSEIFIYKKGR